MGGNFSTVSKALFAAAGFLAVSLFPISAFAGGGDGFKDAPAPSGRTIWEGLHVGGHAGWADFDYGIGIIRVRPNSDPITINGYYQDLTWQDLEANRERWLRLSTSDQIKAWL